MQIGDRRQRVKVTAVALAGLLLADVLTPARPAAAAAAVPKVPPPAATTVTLSPKQAAWRVGTSQCAHAATSTSQGVPAGGVTVSFVITGATPGAGSAVTNPAGVAQFCYRGLRLGRDAVVASVGAVSDTGTWTWVGAKLSDTIFAAGARAGLGSVTGGSNLSLGGDTVYARGDIGIDSNNTVGDMRAGGSISVAGNDQLTSLWAGGSVQIGPNSRVSSDARACGQSTAGDATLVNSATVTGNLQYKGRLSPDPLPASIKVGSLTHHDCPAPEDLGLPAYRFDPANYQGWTVVHFPSARAANTCLAQRRAASCAGQPVAPASAPPGSLGFPAPDPAKAQAAGLVMVIDQPSCTEAVRVAGSIGIAGNMTVISSCPVLVPRDTTFTPVTASAGGQIVIVSLASSGTGDLTVEGNLTVKGQHVATLLYTSGGLRVGPNTTLGPAGAAFYGASITLGTDIKGGASPFGDQPPAGFTPMPDHPPQSSDLMATTNEDTPVAVNVAASDADGDPLAFSIVAGPTHGTLTPADPGGANRTYSPAKDFNGTDTFTYKANDGAADSNVATATITVNPVNDAPVANPDTKSSIQGHPVSFPATDLTANDTPGPPNEASQALTVTAVTAGAATHGSAVLNPGTVTYTPDAAFTGNATFTYTVCDNGTPSLCAIGTVAVTVATNHPPMAANLKVTTPEDTAVATNLNASDVDSDPLTYTVVAAPTHGTLTPADPGGANRTYTPARDFNGTDTFTYKANDGHADSNVATITITITPVNDPPVANPDTKSTLQGHPLSFPATDLTANDTPGPPDEAGQTLAITAVTAIAATHGGVTLTAGTVTYNPDPAFIGTATFNYMVCDSGTPSLCATGAVTVTVGANHPPVASDVTVLTDEDAPIAMNLTATDSDGDPVAYSIVVGPTHGTLTPASPGGANRTYTPAKDFNGTDTFTYKANDGLADSNVATATITINPVNDPPIASLDTKSTIQGHPLSFPATDLTANDTPGPLNEASQALTVTAVAAGAATHVSVTLTAGTVTYTPDPAFTGNATFTYTVCDNGTPAQCATGTVTVTIGANHPPAATDVTVITNEDTPVALSLTGTDTDGDPLTYSIVTGPAHGTVTPAVTGGPVRTYTPAADFNGTDTFTYKTNDGLADSNVGTVTITINPVNDPPIANPDNKTTVQGHPLSFPATDLSANDTPGPPNEATQTLTVPAVIAGAPTHGRVTLIAGTVTYSPDPAFAGTATLTYTVCDNGTPSLCTTGAVMIVVGGDHPPEVSDQAAVTAEDTPKGVTLGVANDSDGDASTFSIVAGPSHGTLGPLVPPGVCVALAGYTCPPSTNYTPNADFNGTDTFTYKANDGLLDSNVATVTVTVTPVNDPPAPSPDDKATVQGHALSFPATDLTTNDTAGPPDEAIQTLTVTAVTTDTGSHGTATLTNGTVTYTPNPAYSGRAMFTYTVCDNGTPSLCADGTVVVTVGADHPPVAADVTVFTDEDTPVAICPNAVDADGDPLRYTIAAGPAHGTVTPSDLGVPCLTYTPTKDFNGTDTFTYVANDGLLDSKVATVAITVNPVNDPPVADPDTKSTAQGQILSFPATDLSSNDSPGPPDEAGQALTVTAVTGTAATSGTVTLVSGAVTYTPRPDFVGDATFTYQVCDSGALCGESVVTVTVHRSANRPPSITSVPTVSQWLNLTPAGIRPIPRYLYGAQAYDEVNDRLIVFSGEDNVTPQPHLLDVWVLTNASGVAGAPTWVEVHPTNSGPSARFMYAAAYDPTANRLIVYGGCSSHCNSLPDAWVLTNANGLGGDSEWHRLPDGGPLAGGAGAFDVVNNRLIVFGGLSGGPGADLSTMRVLVDANGLGTPHWETLNPSGSPPPGRGEPSAATYDQLSNRLIVFGGLSSNDGIGNDTWVLTNANGLGGTPAWSPLNPNGSPPSPRGAVSSVFDPNSAAMITFGGWDGFAGAPHATNETWVLAAANGVGDAAQWRQLPTAGAPPPPRALASVGYQRASNRLVVTLGRDDQAPPPGVFNDTWVLTNASGQCTAGQPCNYAVGASDPDGDPLNYVLDTAPSGMAINASTGAITWTPTPGQTGEHPVTVRVVDPGGLSATQSFTLTVAPVVVPNVVGLDPASARALIGSADLHVGTETTVGGGIALGFGSLPSDQGATYHQDGTLAPEARVFSVDGTTLFQNSIGVGFCGAGHNLYLWPGVVDTRLPYQLSVRARVLDEEGDVTTNSYGFSFGFFTGSFEDGIGIGTHRIADIRNQQIAPAVDPTVFHDYRLQGVPGLQDQFLVDGVVLARSNPVAGSDPNQASVGDGTCGTNARAEVTGFQFSQARVVSQNPPAGTTVANRSPVDLTIAQGPDSSRPVAAPDSYQTNEDTTLEVPAPGVLANDSDPRGAPLTAVLANGPTSGSLTLRPDGSFTYIPAPDFNGTDTFRYKANNGTLNSNIVTVHIEIRAVNDPPIANPDEFSPVAGKSVVIPATDLLANDSPGPPDEASQHLALTAVGSRPDTHGTVSALDGTVTYTPDPGFNGTARFTYTVCDDGTTAGPPDPKCAQGLVTVDVSACAAPAGAAPAGVSPATGTSAAQTSEGAAPMPGSFTPGAPLAAPRLDHTATRLPDGRVLIAGGGSGSGSTRVAELYDPVSGTWSAAGTICSGPVSPTAALMPDGRVMVIGGSNSIGSLASTEIFDATALSWTLGPSMQFARANPQSVKLTDGKILVVDTDPNSPVKGVVEIFDPASNQWTRAADLLVTVAEETLTLLADGRVLVTGGVPTTATVQIYDPVSDQWHLAAPMHIARNGHAAARLLDGRVLVAGGNTSSSSSGPPLRSAEFYDPTLDVWSPAADMNVTRGGGSPMTVLADGRVLITGGWPAYLAPAWDTGELYEPRRNAWEPVGRMSAPRLDHTSTLLSDGRVLVVGSVNQGTFDASASGTVDIFSAVAGPVARDDAYSAVSGTTLSVAEPGVLANDAGAAQPSASLLTAPVHGTANLRADGSFDYISTPGFVGDDSYSYRACDPSGSCDSASVTIAVAKGPPIATDLSVTTSEDTAIDIILAATDVDGDPLTFTIVAAPKHGTATLDSPGGATVTYTPAADFNGTDTFTYKANNGHADSNVATVAVAVNAINDPPFVISDTKAALQGQPLSFPAADLTANDSPGPPDEASQTLTVTALTSSASTHGSATLSGSTVTYIPDPAFTGIARFKYTVCDDGTSSGAPDPKCADGTVEIQVAPGCAAPPTGMVAWWRAEGNPMDTVGSNDGTAMNGAKFGPGKVGQAFAFDGVDDYVLVPNTTGPGGLTLPSAFTVEFWFEPFTTIVSTDRVPHYFLSKGPDDTIGTANSDGNPALNGAEDQRIEVRGPYPRPFSLNNLWEAGIWHHVAVTLGPGGYHLYLDGQDQVSSPDVHSILATANAIAFGSEAGSEATVKPFHGAIDELSIYNRPLSAGEVSAIFAAGSFGKCPLTNQPPVSAGDRYGTDRETTLTVSAPGVLGNDSDADGTPMSASLGAQPAHGTVTLSADGSFAYTPAPGYSGPDTFTYIACAGRALCSALTTVDIAVSTTCAVGTGPPTGIGSPVTPAPGQWRPAGAMGQARNQAVAVVLHDGRLMMIGGQSPDSSVSVRTAEIYDPATGSWTPAGEMCAARRDPAAAVLPDGRVLVAGGVDLASQSLLTTTEIYDPATQRWAIGPTMKASRTDLSAFVLPDGRVMLVGGALPGSVAAQTVEFLDLVAGTSTLSASHSLASGELPVMLHDGRVMVVGTWGGSGQSKHVEIYDPATDSWTSAADLLEAAGGSRQVVLTDGRVLVVAQGSTGAQLYDPSTNLWRFTGPMTVPSRNNETLSLLPDGRALVTGGSGGNPFFGAATFAETELYDPVADRWDRQPDMATSRWGHTGSVLGDGSVLVAGGVSCCPLSVQATAERFFPADASASPHVSTSVVTGMYFSGGSGDFTATVDTPPLFSQNYPSITFNPLAQFIPGDPTGVDGNARPFTNYTTDAAGNFTGTIPGESIGSGGAIGNQVGIGSLFDFQVVYSASMAVSGPGDVTFTFFHDDGFIFSVGGGATRVSGDNANVPPSSPFHGYPTMGGYDGPTPTLPARKITVHFPGAGSYPYEVDYAECCGGHLLITMSLDQSPVVPPTFNLALKPNTATDLAHGAAQIFTATLTDSFGAAQAGAAVTLDVKGVNGGKFNATTDASGVATFSYVGRAGDDIVQAHLTGPSEAVSNLVTVHWSDRAPLAADDSYTTSQGQAVHAAAPGVLANDSDPDGDALTAVIDTAPGNGSVILNPDGSFAYQPEPAFAGVDTFTYKACDPAGLCATATVHVTVAAACAAGPLAAPPFAGQPMLVPGRWVATGSMGQARSGNVTVVLHDGRVLVAGGSDGNPASPTLASAEIYDPKTGTWSPAGAMCRGRDLAAAAVLPDGRVLVTGGRRDCSCPGGSQTLATTDIYDPATGSWTAGPTMNLPRLLHHVLVLNSGKVLVEGGNVGGAATSGTAEILDVGSGVWTTTAPRRDRAQDEAVLLDDGRVLSVGGGYGPAPVAEADIFDPSTGVWTQATDMHSPRATHRLVVLPGGKVLAVGGAADQNQPGLASAEIYDPATDTWTAAASMFQGRIAPSATLLADGRVLVAGGSPFYLRNGSLTPLASSEIYDPATDHWSRQGDMHAARFNQTAALLADKSVVSVGGSSLWCDPDTCPQPALASAEVFLPGPGDRPPVAVVDTLLTSEDQTVALPAPGILANDSDPDTDPLTASLVSGAMHGTLILQADGSLSYTPGVDFNGPDAFSYQACDPAGLCSAAQTVSITVTAVNDPPVANPDTKTTKQGHPLVFPAADLTANDSPGPPDETSQMLTVTAVAKIPATPGTLGEVKLGVGTITYSPVAGSTGNDTFAYTVCDNGTTNGAADARCSDGTVHVVVTTAAPIASIDVSPHGLTLGPTQTRQFQATATYGDGSTADVTAQVTWSSADPSVATISPTGVAAAVAAGTTSIAATVGAISGATALSVDHPAVTSVVVEPATALIPTGNTQTFTARGIHADGTNEVLGRPALTWSSASPTVATIDAAGVASGQGPGQVTITAAYGSMSGTGQLTVKTAVANSSLPTVAITAPSDGETITAPTDIIGTATDPEFLKYVLEIAPAGETNFTTIAESATPVSASKLGTLDPTVLLNDLYTLRLTAFDTGNNTTSTEVTVQVAREQKVGNFSVSFDDLTVPMPGLDVTVTRSYDSRDKTVGDFGVGWRMGLRSVRLRPNRVLGEGWEVTKSGFLFFNLVADGDHTVSVTLPDGKVEAFDMVVSPNHQAAPFDQVTVSYTPRSGTLGSLRPLDGNRALIEDAQPGSVTLLNDDFSGDTFDPQRFEYTSPTGTRIAISRSAGVQSITDVNGNALTITPTAITHSSGVTVTIVRDTQGRITDIADPRGGHILYTYDANGDLASHTDPAGNTTRFLYDRHHNLIEIRDPLGRRPARNDYDDNGRLVAVTDADGNKVNITHDLAANTETVVDRNGHTTVYSYDPDGNVLTQTNAAGTTTHTYDTQGDELTVTDPMGHTTTSTYDAARNLLSETTPLGNTTTYTYGPRNQVLTVTDPLGNVTTNTYDAAGNLTATGSCGATTTMTYDGHGNVLSRTDALGGVTSNTYDAHGDLASSTDAAGVTTNYTYDANNNRLSASVVRTTPTGPQTLVTRYDYDADNRQVRTVYPDGTTTSTVHDGSGKTVATLDELGRVTRSEYDDQGRPVRTVYPDGTSTASGYDANGNQTTSTDEAGRVTTTHYDSLNRPDRVTNPDGTSTSTGYDAAGRTATNTDEAGNTTTSDYDGDSRLTATHRPLGYTTTYSYNSSGLKASETDPSGTRSFAYDCANRLALTTFADSTTQGTGYDALGRRTSSTDQAGVATTYGYDKVGRLTTVTDAMHQVTSYSYDETGDRVSQTDANGHTTRFAYDARGRQTGRTLPLGQAEASLLDASGNVTAHTDFNGRTTAYTYDSLNRLTAKIPDPAFNDRTVSFTYTTTGQRATMVDASGTTTYSYDTRDRLTTKATPEGTLTYTYTPNAKVASLTSSNTGGASVAYSYDTLDRLTTVNDHTLASGLTHYTYDPASNLKSVAYPNGVISTYAYDKLNRVTKLTAANTTTTLASYTYTLGPAGNRTSVTEADGRKVDYTYDTLYRLTGETVTGDSRGINGTATYSYDPVGNRLARNSTLPGVPTTTSTYDANDRLDSEQYDNNGNTLKTPDHTYTYDYDNRLTTADNGAVTIVYDGDGNKVAETEAGVTTRILIDDRNPTNNSQAVDELTAGSVNRSYTYGLLMISQRLGTGDVGFYGYDAHRSVRTLSDNAGNITNTYAYDAFGITTSSTGTTPNRYRYSGEARSASTGAYYLRSRVYQPDDGRFTSADKYAGSDERPISLHRYVYTENSPIDRVDPLGLFSLIDVALTTVIITDLLKAYYQRYLGPLSGKALAKGTLYAAAANVDFYSATSVEDPYQADIAAGKVDTRAAKNGCGGQGGLGAQALNVVLNAIPISQGFDFRPACDYHDQCYGTLGAAKNLCDSQFRLRLQGICHRPIGIMSPNCLADPRCEVLASIYTTAVVSFGEVFYEQGQAEARARGGIPTLEYP